MTRPRQATEGESAPAPHEEHLGQSEREFNRWLREVDLEEVGDAAEGKRAGETPADDEED
jgi:hypothetical protein